MTKTLILAGLIATASLGSNIKECNYYIKMIDMQSEVAIKHYNNGNVIKAQEHFRHALSNGMNAFKNCRGTKREDEAIDKTAIINGILTNKSFRTSANFQKLLKGAK